jgi:quercetin dioxygenase-like cupin family protein
MSEFAVAKPQEMEWSDGEADLALKGAKIKVLNRAPAEDRVDFLVRFPPGYHEPRHTHVGSHISLIVEGTMVVNEGEHVLKPGDYLYGPADEPHGPFDFPEGAVVFSCFRSGMRHDALDGDTARIGEA